jgi:hypothetical protein
MAAASMIPKDKTPHTTPCTSIEITNESGRRSSSERWENSVIVRDEPMSDERPFHEPLGPTLDKC